MLSSEIKVEDEWYNAGFLNVLSKIFPIMDLTKAFVACEPGKLADIVINTLTILSWEDFQKRVLYT